MNPRIFPIASMFPFVTVIFFWEQFAKCFLTTVSQLSAKHNLHIRCVFMRSNLLPYYFWKFYFLFLYYTTEKPMAPHSITLPGKSHGWRSLVGCSPWGPEELDMAKRLHFHFSLSCIGEGNGNPLQCSFLENPRDGGDCRLVAPSMGSHRVGHDWSDLAAAAEIYPSAPQSFPFVVRKFVFLCLSVCFCFVNELICIKFLDSACKW